MLEASGAADHGGPVTRPAAALRALAQGRALCPGHVTVVPRMAMTCSLSGGLAPVRSGATITFAGCELEGGGRLDGTVDIAARLRTSDSACDSKTTVSVSYTTSLTDFSYRDRGGAQVLIPSLSDVGSYTRPAAGAPTGLNIRTEGTIQRIDASGAITASHGVRGAGDYTFTAGGTGLASSVEGALAISDRAGGLPVTATGHAVTITSGCCRPTGGSLVLGRSGRAWGAWTFGPACGAMRLDGATARAADCP